MVVVPKAAQVCDSVVGGILNIVNRSLRGGLSIVIYQYSGNCKLAGRCYYKFNYFSRNINFSERSSFCVLKASQVCDCVVGGNLSIDRSPERFHGQQLIIIDWVGRLTSHQ